MIFGDSAVLAHFMLNEKLQRVGVLGCVLCIVGSTVIILHAPEERSPSSVEQIWRLATQPCKFPCCLHSGSCHNNKLVFWHVSCNVVAAFLCYAALAVAVSLFLMLYCAPRYGQENIMVYVGICSVVGSLTVNVLHDAHLVSCWSVAYEKMTSVWCCVLLGNEYQGCGHCN
jgi:hypothetical protein